TGRPGREDAGSGGRGPGRHGRAGAADREQGPLALRRGMDVRVRAGRREARTVTTESSIVPPGRNTAAEAVALCQNLAGQLHALGFTPPGPGPNPLARYLLTLSERAVVDCLLTSGPRKGDVVARQVGEQAADGRATPRLRILLASLVERGVLAHTGD